MLGALSPESIRRNQEIFIDVVAKYYGDPDFKAKVDADADGGAPGRRSRLAGGRQGQAAVQYGQADSCRAPVSRHEKVERLDGTFAPVISGEGGISQLPCFKERSAAGALVMDRRVEIGLPVSWSITPLSAR